MDFAPDYGLKLRSLGVPDDFEAVFIPFEMLSLSIDPVDGLFISTANTDLNGEEHALTLEFSPETFRAMLRLLPFQFAIKVRETLNDGPQRPFCFEFPFPVPLTIRARFGDVQANDYEKYLPMRVTCVEPCPGATRDWLTYDEVDNS